MSDASEITIYQLKIVRLGINPTIWNLLRIRTGGMIAELHLTLKFVMGWTDGHLPPVFSTLQSPQEFWLPNLSKSHNFFNMFG